MLLTGISIVTYLFNFLNWPTVFLTSGLSLVFILIILRLLYDQRVNDKRGIELTNTDDFVDEYKKIKRNKHIIKCDLIWSGYYNESSYFTFDNYFSEESNFLMNHKYAKFRRIINFNDGEKSINRNHYLTHIKRMQKVHENRQYDTRTSDIKNFELVYSERQANQSQIVCTALIIFFNDNGIPIWGYLADTEKNPDHSEMIAGVGNFFESEWKRAKEIKDEDWKTS